MVQCLSNPLCNQGDMGSIPGNIPHAAGQLSPHATTKTQHSQSKIIIINKINENNRLFFFLMGNACMLRLSFLEKHFRGEISKFKPRGFSGSYKGNLTWSQN